MYPLGDLDLRKLRMALSLLSAALLDCAVVPD